MSSTETWLTQEAYDRLHGRAGRPLRPAPHRDHEADRGRPRGGRPQGERRLPRRQGGAGQERGARPAAAPPARERADRRRPGERRRGRAGHRSSRSRFAGDDDTETFLLGSREEAAHGLDRRLLADLAARRRRPRQAGRRRPASTSRPNGKHAAGRDRHRGALRRLTPRHRRPQLPDAGGRARPSGRRRRYLRTASGTKTSDQHRCSRSACRRSGAASARPPIELRPSPSGCRTARAPPA